MNKAKKGICFYLLFLCFMQSMSHTKDLEPVLFQTIQSPLIELPTITEKKEQWVTVFVHGIMSIQPHLTLQNLMRFIRDDVQDSVYSKTVEYMRANPYFYLNQAMQTFGLKKIDPDDLQPGHAASAIAKIYDEVTKLTEPQTNSDYYTFGWAGLLSPTTRYNDGVKLFEDLNKELEEKFWRHNIFPKVRLVGYSHGGNVCLNVAAARQKTDPSSRLSIDELLLVGVPIQTETDFLVNDPIFKKIYHVFSRADRIQRIDFFSFNRIFSRRYFSNRNNFKVPKKLMQIEIKLMKRTRTKHEKNINSYLNFENPEIISGKSHLLRNNSPGHLEFWFFGWSPRYYRSEFCIHPLPTFVMLPYVLHCIKQIKGELVNPYPVIADIRPEFETMIIKQRKQNHITAIFPFLSKTEQEYLIRIANQVGIDSSFEDEYNTHLQAAFKQAKEYYHIYDDRKARPGPRRRNRRMRKRNLTSYQVPDAE